MSGTEEKNLSSMMKNAVKIDGVWLHKFPMKDSLEQHMKNIKELEIRRDDIFILGFPKCGTHWAWEIISMLLKGKTEYQTKTKEYFMLEAAPQEVINALESPRILNSHLWLRFLPQQLFTMKSKIVFVVRNPRDVCVSMFCHMKGMREDFTGASEVQFSDFLDMFVEGKGTFNTMAEYLVDSESVLANHPDLPVLFLLYEDMKKEPEEHVKKIASFLGIKSDDSLCSAVADACSSQKLKQAHINQKKDYLQDLWKKDATGIYRKGVVGDWKNWLTVAQSEKFDRIFKEEMKDSRYASKYF